ncbi:MAG: radical SAM protein [Eubacteriales bacterium]|nr:radical SAM protein [Eubacteriales bacterium]
MDICSLCPRNCKVDRQKSQGFCGCFSLPNIARIGLHHYEEPPISGTNGSGAIFFSGCNLRCVFCQNVPLRDSSFGEQFDQIKLADAMLELQDMQAHNINLVTPTPHIKTISKALTVAKKRGLTIPIIYNTNAYLTDEALSMLSGLIDVYLPDLKYKSTELSKRFSGAENYFDNAITAISTMRQQVGNLTLDQNGLVSKGVLIRHLVLPGCTFDTRDILDEILARFNSDAYISLMRQYTPTSGLCAPLNRRLTDREYQGCIDYCVALGLNNVFLQDKESASFKYTPQFSNKVVISK